MTRHASVLVFAAIACLALAPASFGQAAATKPAPAPAGKAAQAPAPPASKPAAGAPAPTPAGKAAQAPAPAASKPAAGSSKPAPTASAPAAQKAVPAAPVARTAPSPGLAAVAQDSYSYRAEGRRDPFISLLNRGSDPRSQRRPEGLAGMLAGDVVLRGILQSRGTYLAIVQGPSDKRQVIVRPNDRFADGVVKAITADSMLILQEVNDPLSLTKQREIRKTLRAVEEVK